MMHDLYAANYQKRRQETFLRAAGRCENVLNGQRCPYRLGTFKISHAHNPYFEQLCIHHPNDGLENPLAKMMAVCMSCHMKLHRKPDASGTVAARKRGYTVVSIRHLLTCLQATGFVIQPKEECHVTWCIGPLQGEAADALDAVGIAMHWLSAEVRDLQKELAQARAENLRLTDRVIRTQHAEERRFTDAAARHITCCY